MKQRYLRYIFKLKEIQAYTESQMKFNMNLHKEKCKKVKTGSGGNGK